MTKCNRFYNIQVHCKEIFKFPQIFEVLSVKNIKMWKVQTTTSEWHKLSELYKCWHLTILTDLSTRNKCLSESHPWENSILIVKGKSILGYSLKWLSHKKQWKNKLVFLVSFHIMLRMYEHTFITTCKSIILFHTFCQESVLLSLLYLKYFLFYFVWLPIQQPEKEQYIL